MPIVPISAAKNEGVRGARGPARLIVAAQPEGPAARDGPLPAGRAPCTAASTRSRTSSKTMPSDAGLPSRFCGDQAGRGRSDHAAASSHLDRQREGAASSTHRPRDGERDRARTARRRSRTCATRSSQGVWRTPWSRCHENAREHAALHQDRSRPHRHNVLRPPDLPVRDAADVLSHVQRHRRSGCPTCSQLGIDAADRRLWTPALTAYGINPVVHSPA